MLLSRTQKRVLAWELLGVVIIWALVGASLFEARRLKVEAELKADHGWLYPDHESDPYGVCHPSDGQLAMYVGSYSLLANSFPQTLVAIRSVPVVVIDKKADGAISLSLTVKSPDGRIIVQMEKGEFEINTNNIFRMYRPDRSRLKIRDQSGNLVLDAHYLNTKAMRLEAVFYQNDQRYDLSQVPIRNICLARIVPPGSKVTGNMINLQN